MLDFFLINHLSLDEWGVEKPCKIFVLNSLFENFPI